MRENYSPPFFKSMHNSNNTFHPLPFLHLRATVDKMHGLHTRPDISNRIGDGRVIDSTRVWVRCDFYKIRTAREIKISKDFFLTDPTADREIKETKFFIFLPPLGKKEARLFQDFIFSFFRS